MRAVRLRRFVPFDVDASMLSAAGSAIQREYPGVEIAAVCGDFEEHLAKIPSGGRRLFVFLGSTIGNLVPDARAEFLACWPWKCDAAEYLGTALLYGRFGRSWHAQTALVRRLTAAAPAVRREFNAVHGVAVGGQGQ